MKNDFEALLRFWFEEISPAMWWKKEVAFDEEIRHRFFHLHQNATRGELDSWRDLPEGALAEIILLDQFSRNMFRNDPTGFQWDPLALALAQTAIRLKYNQKLSAPQRLFMYMPFMHSESEEIHKKAVELFGEEDLKDNLEYELQHKKIIDRFGRYPHRNRILHRESSAEELAFLKESGSSF